MIPAVQVLDLVKSFGSTPAVRGVSLEVPAGQVLGLLGPNGAGKTTLIRMVSTLVKPDGGQVLVHGLDVVRQARRVRRLIGLTGQYASVDEDLSGWENLYVIARLFNLPRRRARARADEMLARVALTDVGGRPVRGYSGGMRRRLDLAASLVGEPRVLFLDEPTTGLDPHSRNSLWEEVRRLAGEGTAVLLTTQYMEEAEALADSVVVIDKGRVTASGSSAELREQIGGQVLRILPENLSDLAAVRLALAAAGHPTADPDATTGHLQLPITGGPAQLTSAIKALSKSGVPVAAVDTHVPSLDEVFLILTASPTEVIERSAA